MVERKLSRADSFDNLEETVERELTSAGYKTGFELGKRQGQEDAFSRGYDEGQRVGSEVGLYRGYTIAWIQLLQSTSSPLNTKSSKTLNKLEEVLKLVENFPNDNGALCEEKLLQLRTKFKRLASLFNLRL